MNTYNKPMATSKFAMKKIFLSLCIAFFAVAPAFSQDSKEMRGMTADEYKMALTAKVDNPEEDTYVKLDDNYVLDRYELKKPYFITGDSGVKKRIVLFNMLDRASMKPLGTIALFTNTETNETFNLVIPNMMSEAAIWDMYFDDIHQHDREEGDVALKMSYILSKEFAYLMRKSDGADMSAMDGNNADYDFCFPAAALVTLKDGSQKAIAEVKIGEEIIAFQNNAEQVVTVEGIDVHKKNEIQLAKAFLAPVEEITASTDGLFKTRLSELVATANHPVMTAEGKKELGKLAVEDVVYQYNDITKSFEAYQVIALEKDFDTVQEVYNLEVSGDNYVVNNTVVLEK